MKIPLYIAISAALVWFGGAGLAFATCPAPAPIPDCHCPYSSDGHCHCGDHAPKKTVPACAINHAPLPTCPCSITRGDSAAINITVNSGIDPAIIIESDSISPITIAITPDQIFQASPSYNTPIAPLRI